MTPRARRAVLAWVLASAVVWVGIGALLLGWYPR